MSGRFKRLASGQLGYWIVPAAALLCGCGSDGLALAPVEGTVLMDGAPVAEAGVMFSPVNAKKGLPAMGTTDEQGKFTLITANKPGALLGEHRVAISKSQVVAIPQKRGLPIYKSKELIPPKFSSFDTSGLTASVKDDDNKVKFELSSK